MTAKKERQISFAGGELAPTFWGRTDMNQYLTGARLMRNLVVVPSGVAQNRPGFQHVAPLETTKCRLVPFIVDENTSFILAFKRSQRNISVFKESAEDPRFSLSLVNTLRMYSGFGLGETQLQGLKYVQKGLSLTITAPGMAPSEIFYDVDADAWSGVIIDFTPPPFSTLGGEEGVYYRMRFETEAEDDESGSLTPDSEHPARQWSWRISHVARLDLDGKLYETNPRSITEKHLVGTGTDVDPEEINPIGAKHAIYPDRPFEFYIGLSAGDTFPSTGEGTYTIEKTRLYRGRGGFFGFIIEGSEDVLVDDGADPDYGNPPRFPKPRWWIEGVYAPEADEEPIVPFFFESRRILAGSVDRPATIWGSSVELHDNFDEVILADDSDAYEFTLAGRLRQVVRWFADLGNLLVGASGGVWLVQGSGEGEIITPNSIWAHVVFNKGVSDLLPVDTGDSVFFTELKGGHPYVVEKGPQGGFRFTDVSLLSSHFFDGYTVVDWAYSDNPHRILWVARSDGALLSFTYIPEIGIAAWCQHEIAGDGKVEALASKPEPGEDGVWAVVMYEDSGGTKKRYLMRMGKRLLPLADEIQQAEGDTTEPAPREPDVRFSLFLDRAVSYNGKAAVAQVMTFDGEDMTIGDQDTISISGSPTLSAGDILKIDDPKGGLAYKLRVDSDDGGGDYTISLMNRELEGSLVVTTWWLCSTGVNGLEHFNGKTVTVLADGNSWYDVPVVAGSINLQEGNEAGIIHAGATFNADFESLDAVQDKGNEKVIKKIRVEVEHTRGGSVGQDFDHLQDIPTRSVAHGYLPCPLTRREEEILVAGSWDTKGRVVLRQKEPLPITILGITRENEQGGR